MAASPVAQPARTAYPFPAWLSLLAVPELLPLPAFGLFQPPRQALCPRCSVSLTLTFLFKASYALVSPMEGFYLVFEKENSGSES